MTFKICAQCKHVYIKHSCACEFGTYRSVRAVGWKETILRWVKIWS
jgi:hypothetical protein